MNKCLCGCGNDCKHLYVSGHNSRVQISPGRFKKGISSWNKGKHHTLETKLKMHYSHLGQVTYIRTPETNLKNSLSMLGKPSKKKNKTYNEIFKTPHNAEKVKKKISETEKQTIRKLVEQNNHIYTSGHKHFKATKPELKFKDMIINNGFIENEDFKHGKGIYDIKHGYIADFYFPKTNTVVEIDGTYWHNYPNRLHRDHIRTKELIENGYRVLRIWETEINKYNEEYIINYINNIGEIL